MTTLDKKINRVDHDAAIREKDAQIAMLTKQLAAEVSLRKSLQQAQFNGHLEWQSTFNTIKEAIIVLDRELEVVNANEAAYDLLAMNQDEILGRRCYQLFVGNQTPCSDCPLQVARSSGKRHTLEIERPFLGKTLEVSCAPVFHGTELVGYIHSAIDISRQRSLEKQLVQAQKMEAVATLAGGIAHDFNNILGAILGNADLLLYRLPESFNGELCGQGQLTAADIEDHLAAIKKASLRAQELVSQILAFSRQSTARTTKIIITTVVKEAVKLLQSSLPSTIELNADLSPDIGYIRADPTQVHQVLMNLCTNAVDAIGDGHGRIDISLSEVTVEPRTEKSVPNLKNGDYVVLTVRDNGSGMTDDIMERIYEPFFTTRSVGEGTGMGLAVLHGIVSAHNGVVEVNSQPGEGTVFKVYFPLAAPLENNSDADRLTSMPTGSETIIFADDEEDIVKMHTRMLVHLGYTVIPASGGDQVFACLENPLQKVDLIITDQTMPKMTGLELVKKVHDIRSDLPVILCSGNSEALDDATASRLQIDKFLAKPIKMKELAVTIREVLSR